MTLYFLSKTPAALKLNGTYAGVIDLFERRVEVEREERLFAEIIPGNNGGGLNFFIDGQFFSSPPDFADVYLMGDDALIFIKRFTSKDSAVRVVWQTRFYDNLITLFTQGGVQLSCEGKGFELYELDDAFKSASYREELIGGKPVLIISAEGSLCIISSEGKRVFYNAAESFTCGDMLEVTVDFETCAGAKARCGFSYDGEKMTLAYSKTEETAAPAEDVLHFAFFESVLTRGDYEKYLCEQLKEKAGALPSYLGEFIAVTIPPSKFYAVHGDIRAAGLVFPKGRNLFEVKYFCVDLKDGKIENVYEVE